jgi:hypothetical protein
MQLQRGKGRQAAFRALAFKWQRIMWRCWQDRVSYDDTTVDLSHCLLRKAAPPQTGAVDPATRSAEPALVHHAADLLRLRLPRRNLTPQSAKGVLNFVVTLKAHKDVRSYPCRSMGSAIKLVERFIAANPHQYDGPPRTAEQVAA